MSGRLEKLVQLPQVARSEPIVIVEQDVQTVAEARQSQCARRKEGRIPHSDKLFRDYYYSKTTTARQRSDNKRGGGPRGHYAGRKASLSPQPHDGKGSRYGLHYVDPSVPEKQLIVLIGSLVPKDEGSRIKIPLHSFPKPISNESHMRSRMKTSSWAPVMVSVDKPGCWNKWKRPGDASPDMVGCRVLPGCRPVMVAA